MSDFTLDGSTMQMGAIDVARISVAAKPLCACDQNRFARSPFHVPDAPAEWRPARVGFLLISGFAMLSFAAATECLRAANHVEGKTLYEWDLISPDGAPAIASNGIPIPCGHAIQANKTFDYIFVLASDEGLSFDDHECLRWLRSHARSGAAMGGISGGTFVLARAGLLEHRRVTLHWVYSAAFAEEFPTADIRQSLFEIDGNRLTCGGATAAIDMLHELLLRERGKGLADRVSDWFLQTEVREGQNPQRLAVQTRLGVNHVGLGRALEAMEKSLEEPLTRDQIANVARVSKRQLDRLFITQIGRTVSAYYLELRLKRAQQLVRQSALSQLEITFACGFQSSSSFSKAYRAEFGVPPSKDRIAGAAVARRQDFATA